MPFPDVAENFLPVSLLASHFSLLNQIWAAEENSWLYYLATIEDRQLSKALLVTTKIRNLSQRVRAQESFFGEAEAKATGFLESAHDEPLTPNRIKPSKG